jgi:hypothetical protein
MQQLEHDHQSALFEWATLNQGRWPELDMMYAIPNGGHRNIQTAARLKREGVKRGVLDINLDVPRFGFHGLRIELKVGRNKPTREQLQWIERLTDHGYLAVVCWGWESARAQIEAYLK